MYSLRMLTSLTTVVLAALAGEPDSVFDLAGEKSPRVVVTAGPALPGPEPMNGMLGEVNGVLATLQRAGFMKLRACVDPDLPVEARPTDAESACYLHIVGDTASKLFEVVRDMSGDYVVVEQGAYLAEPVLARLDRARFDELGAEWSQYRGSFDAGGVKEQRGVAFRVQGPYSPGRFRLDAPTLASRMGGKWTTPSERDLGQEVFVARLPKTYDPRKPAALLVWLGPSAAIGDQLAERLDKYGVIAISCEADVEAREPQDRCQLGLDACATAQRRWHVDTRLVYIGGFSEGAASAVTLGICFPDVFTGTLAVGGFSCYRPVPTGQGTTTWPAEFARPRKELFELFLNQPMVLIAGTADFNYGRIVAGAQVLRDDGARVAPHDFDGLGHEIPTPKQFGRYSPFAYLQGRLPDERRKEDRAAGKAWDLYTAKYPIPDPGDREQRKMLENVIDAAPWSELAWKAVEILEKR